MISIKNDIIELEILPLGVTFKTFKLLSDDVNIITAYEDENQYKNNDVFLGSCIGPLAGRTAQGMYGLDLDENEAGYHLHGGIGGISSQVFDVEKVDQGAIFTLNNDGIEYTIKVSLKEHNVMINFKAVPKVARPINMTNHMYFNLLGTDSIDEHSIQIEASKVSLHNKDMFNDGTIVDVKNTVFDLEEEHILSDVLKQTHPQFELTRHIDHTFVGQDLILKTQNKTLEIHGTMPAIHVYLANFFDETFKNEHGRLAKNYSAIAVEAQYIPNDPKMPVYSTEKPYVETITYTLK